MGRGFPSFGLVNILVYRDGCGGWQGIGGRFVRLSGAVLPGRWMNKGRNTRNKNKYCIPKGIKGIIYLQGIQGIKIKY